MTLRLPPGALVVLIGPSNAGKSTFAAQHFLPTQVLSSDALRAMVTDDAADQSATEPAFELLHAALEMRMTRGRLSVVDATNVEDFARARVLAAAVGHRRPAIAIVFDLPLATCLRRNESRADRNVPAAAIRRHHARMRASIPRLAGEGFDPVLVLSSDEDVAAVTIDATAG